MAARGSVTGRYLAGASGIDVPARRRVGNGHLLRVVGAREHNLKEIDVDLPLGTFTVITGVSGSGKSTLLSDVLYPALANAVGRARMPVGAHRRLEGIERVDKVINIDQSPIGRTPALQPGHLRRPLRSHPRPVLLAPRSQGARLQAGPLLVQRQGRPLRKLPGRGTDQDRDALPARRVHRLRRVQGPALQPRDPRYPLQGTQHPRGPGDDRGGGAGVLSRQSRPSPAAWPRSTPWG